MSRSSGAILLAAALVAACAGAPPAPPPVDDGKPIDRAKPPDVVRPQAPPTTAGSGAPALLRLANGVNVFAHPFRGESTAVLQIGFLAGTDFASPASAELAAACVVDCADATNGRPSLRDAIAKLGGTVEVDVDALTTWITVVVPQNRWLDAERQLGAALAAPPASRTQIERTRDDYVLRRIQQVWNDGDRELARAFQLGFGSTAGYIGALLDRDPSEVSLFAARVFRPDLSTLVLRVPAATDRLPERLADGIAKWPTVPSEHVALPIQTRRLTPGLYWSANAAPTSHAVVLLPLPAMTLPGAADLFLLHSCVTLDGVGGRLEQMLQRRGLGHIRWKRSFLPLIEAPAIVLAADVLPAEVPVLWSVVQDARRSLRDLPPTRSEIELGLRRAPLLAQLLQPTAPAMLRNRAMRTLSGQGDMFERRMQMLTGPGTLDLTAQIERYLAHPAAMVVLGGAVPPAVAAEARPFDLLPTGAYARLASPDPIVQTQVASPWIDGAIEACGGNGLLGRLAGFTASCELRAESAPTTTEALAWQRDPPRITRQREVLGQTIATVLEAGNATETLGTTKVSLPGNMAGLMQREVARHPAALLAACARGDLRFRPVAQRTVGDRDLMILEAFGGPLDRLRVHIDTVSQLIRVVEVWETTSEGAFVHVSEAWSDYRSVGGLRVPFRRIAEIDDGKNRVETIYKDFTPDFAAR